MPNPVVTAYAESFQQALREKLAGNEHLVAAALSALAGGTLGSYLGGQLGYWFSPSPYYRDVNWSELQGKIMGGLGGAAVGGGLGAAAVQLMRTLGKKGPV